jgi:hypothetical protein
MPLSGLPDEFDSFLREKFPDPGSFFPMAGSFTDDM